MKVYIDSKYHDFDSGYNPHSPSDNGWRKQNQDAFKFSIIAGKKVFVKRFEKKASNIPGYPFLVKIKNKKYNSIPMVYDLVKEVENGKEVIYLFQEYIEGNTFEEIMHSGVLHFNPQKFLKNIYDALSVTKQNGFWYADFVEKNIFVAKNGDFYLIDLDSTLLLSILPNDNENIGAVNKNYKIAVSTYWYRDTFGYPFTYIAKNLRGDTINFLELFIFIAQIRYYIDNISHCNFLDVNTRKAIPKYLLDKNEALTYALFKSCFQDTSNHQQVPAFMLLENYISKVLFPEKEKISIDFTNAKIIKSTPSKDKPIDKKKEVIKGLVEAINYNIDEIGDTKAARNCLKQIKSIDANYSQISSLEQKIKELEDYQRQVENTIRELVEAINYNIDEIGDTVAARRYFKEIKELDPNYYQISTLERKIKRVAEINRAIGHLKSRGKSPYKCPNCSFPVMRKAKTFFYRAMQFISAIVIVSIFIDYDLALLGIIVGPLIFGIISGFLPKSWFNKKLECKHCHHSYYVAEEKWE